MAVRFLLQVTVEIKHIIHNAITFICDNRSYNCCLDIPASWLVRGSLAVRPAFPCHEAGSRCGLPPPRAPFTAAAAADAAAWPTGCCAGGKEESLGWVGMGVVGGIQLCCGCSTMSENKDRESDGRRSVFVWAALVRGAAGAGEGWGTIAEGQLVRRHRSTRLPVHNLISYQRLKNSMWIGMQG